MSAARLIEAPHPDTAPRIMRRREVCGQTGLGRSALYAAIKDGRFPKPIKLGLRASGWIEAEVAEWITERIAARDAAEAAAVKPNHA